MTTVLLIADLFRRLLVPFLIGAAILFGTLLLILVIQRWVRTWALARERQRVDAWQPLVDRLLGGTLDGRGRAQLRLAARRRPVTVSRLLAAPLAALAGAPVADAAAFARESGLTDWLRAEARGGAWWRRADAIRTLGALAERQAFDAIVTALDDIHEEVRAAAAGALGRLGDPRAVPLLLDRLPDQSRHQRVRIIEALGAIGPDVTEPLLARLRDRPSLLPFAADLVSGVAGAAATDDLRRWIDADDTGVRAAAWRVAGDIGLDDLGFYAALKALTDDAAAVRGMAARALGRARRADAAPYLAQRLGDEWAVAAESARALGRLDGPGRAALTEHAGAEGTPGDLARQVLWELDHRGGMTARAGA